MLAFMNPTVLPISLPTMITADGCPFFLLCTGDPSVVFLETLYTSARREGKSSKDWSHCIASRQNYHKWPYHTYFRREKETLYDRGR